MDETCTLPTDEPVGAILSVGKGEYSAGRECVMAHSAWLVFAAGQRVLESPDPFVRGLTGLPDCPQLGCPGGVRRGKNPRLGNG